MDRNKVCGNCKFWVTSGSKYLCQKVAFTFYNFDKIGAVKRYISTSKSDTCDAHELLTEAMKNHKGGQTNL